MLKQLWNSLDSVIAALEFVGARFGAGILVGAATGWLLAKASGEENVGFAAGIAVGIIVFIGALVAGIVRGVAQRRNRAEPDEQSVA